VSLQKLPPKAAKPLSRLTYRAKSGGATVELRWSWLRYAKYALRKSLIYIDFGVKRA
jgi:hypothetical protein